jgi:hypothetical protein
MEGVAEVSTEAAVASMVEAAATAAEATDSLREVNKP